MIIRIVTSRRRRTARRMTMAAMQGCRSGGRVGPALLVHQQAAARLDLGGGSLPCAKERQGGRTMACRGQGKESRETTAANRGEDEDDSKQEHSGRSGEREEEAYRAKSGEASHGKTGSTGFFRVLRPNTQVWEGALIVS
jgi:hypothetical protein